MAPGNSLSTEAKLSLIAEDKATATLEATKGTAEKWAQDVTKGLGITEIAMGNLTAKAVLFAKTMAVDVAKGLWDGLNAMSAISDEMRDQEATTGQTTERLQEFAWIEESLRAKAGTLAASHETLAKAMLMAQQGSEKALMGFRELGVGFETTDGKLRDLPAVFDDVMRRLGELPAGAERTALAVKLLGEATENLKFATAGPEKLRELAEEAHNLGRVLDETTMDEYEDFFQAQLRLRAELEETGRAMAKLSVGPVTTMLREMRTLAEEVQEVDRGWLYLNTSLDKTTRNLLRIGIAKLMDEGRTAVANYLSTPAYPGGPSIGEFLRKGPEEAPEALDLPDRSKKKPEDIAAIRAKRDETAAEEKRKREEEREAAKMLAEAEREAQAFTRREEQANAELARRQEADARELARLQETGATELELLDMRHLEEERRWSGHYEVLAALDDSYNKARRKAQQKQKTERLGDLASLFGSTASLMESFGVGSLATQKKFAIAEAVVNTYAGVTQALRSYPPPHSWAMAAATLAMGMRQVQSIRSASPGGGAEGGGGAGAGAGGETTATDTWKPPAAETIQPAEATKPRGSVTIQILNPILTRDFVTGDVIPLLREAAADGYDFGRLQVNRSAA